MKTGIALLQNRPWSEMVELARWLEGLEFETVWIPDHMAQSYTPHMPWADAWVVLGGLAQATSRVRLGTMVSCMTFRNPVVLAREALTVDLISDGRVDVGVGAAGAELDHRMAGIPRWSTAERVARFAEFIELLGQRLANDCRDYDGRYYVSSGGTMEPGPVQLPRPPLVVAAQGPRSLRTAARFADRWVAFAGYPTPSRTDPSRNTVAYALTQAGERIEGFRLACQEHGRDPATMRKTMALVGACVESAMESANALVEIDGQFREIGFDDVIIWPHDAGGKSPFDHDRRAQFEAVLAKAAPYLRDRTPDDTFA